MIIVPAGKYYVGDPCYAFNEGWIPLLESCDYFDRPAAANGVVAFSTAYGDGVYHDGDGRRYMVDAGLIGIVPVDVAECEEVTGMHLVEFTTPVRCDSDEGVISFKADNVRIEINTDYELEEPSYHDEEEDDE